MRVILATDNSIPSIAIRTFTWADWHHGGVIINNEVVEATAKKGVVKTPLKEFISRYNKYVIVEIPHIGDYQKRALDQLGKKYDWGGIFHFVFRRDWSKEDKWFCFELIAFASGVYNVELLNKVTANHILMIAKEVT